MIDKTIISKLITMALEARDNAYCPYSGYAVGASLITDKNEFYTGCNIENSSYGATNCAERTAIFKAISEGNDSIKAIAIVGAIKGKAPTDYAYPCGICRQVMSEFASKDFIVIVAKNENDYKVFTLDDILPAAFTKSNME